jgi:protein TonB
LPLEPPPDTSAAASAAPTPAAKAPAAPRARRGAAAGGAPPATVAAGRKSASTTPDKGETRPAPVRAKSTDAKPAPTPGVVIPRFVADASASPAASRKAAPRKAKAAPLTVAPAIEAPASPLPPRARAPGPSAVAAREPAPPAFTRAPVRLAPAGALPPATIPPEALASPRQGRLVAIAIGASLLVHGFVMALHFTMPDLAPKASDAPLEVALVNARTKARPSKADILAQANLDGGGNTDQNRRAKSPLPVLPKDTQRNEITVATERVEALEQQTKELLTQLRSGATVAPRPTPTDEKQPTESPTANEMMQKTLEAMRLEAQIAKDMDAYQKRPKRQFVGSRAQEYRFARYVEDWRLKIERIGNLNYPSAARDRKLHGSLILTVGIRADGSVESIEVNRPSGQRILDAAAEKIVTMSAPFAAFPPDIRRDTDILYITRTWSFTKGDELTSQ